MIHSSGPLCKNCKKAYSLVDDDGKGICIGLLKEPKPHPKDKFTICFMEDGQPNRYGLMRAELIMLLLGSSTLLLYEEIKKKENNRMKIDVVEEMHRMEDEEELHGTSYERR